MASTVWTQEKLDALESAIAEGVLVVEYSDKKITYRSLKEMNSIREQIKKELGLAPKSARLYAQHSKGV